MEIFLKEYLSTLKLERNLSGNTVLSYKNDISSLIGFLEAFKITDPSQVSKKELNSFFSSLSKTGLSSNSAARYYSSIKGFFRYLFVQNYIKENPMEKVSSPKLRKGLPLVLSVNEVDSILSRPNSSNVLGLRDKALLELLYACGVRVSELLGLKVSDLYFNEEMIRVFGKGSKERLIPVGRSAVKWVKKYLIQSRT